jgi:hypothetical protein
VPAHSGMIPIFDNSSSHWIFSCDEDYRCRRMNFDLGKYSSPLSQACCQVQSTTPTRTRTHTPKPEPWEMLSRACARPSSHLHGGWWCFKSLDGASRTYIAAGRRSSLPYLPNQASPAPDEMSFSAISAKPSLLRGPFIGGYEMHPQSLSCLDVAPFHLRPGNATHSRSVREGGTADRRSPLTSRTSCTRRIDSSRTSPGEVLIIRTSSVLRDPLVVDPNDKYTPARH